jgi:hypothetical protein
MANGGISRQQYDIYAYKMSAVKEEIIQSGKFNAYSQHQYYLKKKRKTLQCS